jgi:hypothetical protein
MRAPERRGRRERDQERSFADDRHQMIVGLGHWSLSLREDWYAHRARTRLLVTKKRQRRFSTARRRDNRLAVSVQFEDLGFALAPAAARLVV